MPETTKPRARQVLDRIRAQLGTPTPRGWACLTCGGKLPSPQAAPGACPLCRGQRVRAENLVRALREEARLEPPAAGLGTRWARVRAADAARDHGGLEQVAPLLPTRQWPR